ncbi:MAG: MgtC/SapB family protein, partial [Armatimonadetes bacterium]|nr:MgtC/SapB family protein [Armatimonadota bacterium]
MSALLGAIIGVERETHGRPAGLRTHILVCVGSTLFTICSYLIAGTHNDPGRITAQIVTGIGFLGAGTIIHQGSVVRGLTTAASVWTVAAIGVGVGIGGYALTLAAITSVIVFATLNWVPLLEKQIMNKRDERSLRVTIPPGAESISCTLSEIYKHNLKLVSLTREDISDQTSQAIIIRLQVPVNFEEEAFSESLASCS